MTIKVKVIPVFPSGATATSPIVLTKTNGVYAFTFDMTALLSALTPLFQPISNVDQEITSGATALIANDAATVRINKTVGGIITLTMPLANAKTVPVLIADWKGDAGTNNITIVPSGSEKIQGLASWTIAADNGSVFLRPIANKGYAL